MSRTTLLQERRMQTFQNVLGHWQARRLSALEAAEMLGMSERSFRRYRRRYEDDGLDGLFDRRLDKASARRVPADRIEWVLEQYRTRHTGWTVKHFHDHLCAHHGFAWSYTWTKTTLQRAGLVSKAPRRGAHRRRRPRKPCVGMMLHQDGSRHEWLAGQAACDLIVTMDDATSEIYSAFLVEGGDGGLERGEGGLAGLGPADVGGREFQPVERDGSDDGVGDVVLRKAWMGRRPEPSKAPGLAPRRTSPDFPRSAADGGTPAGLIGAVAVEGVGLAALVGSCRLFVEQVAFGDRRGLQLGIRFVQAEALHAVTGAAVRAGAVGDLGFLFDPPGVRFTLHLH